MFYYIFETTNTITNEKYRGTHYSITPTDKYLGASIALQKAIKEYGRENFKRTILEYCLDRKELSERESIYITDEWIAREDTYNKKRIGVCIEKKERTSEWKKNISSSIKKLYEEGFVTTKGKTKGKMTDEHRKNISEGLKLAYLAGHNGNKGKRWEKEKPTEEQVELMVRKRLESIDKKKSVETMVKKNTEIILKLKF
jgi:hypothetical protein